MPTSTFEAVCRYNSSATFRSVGTFSFSGASPITPKRAKRALQDSENILLSSPVENYAITTEDDPDPSKSDSLNRKIILNHTHSDRQRVGAKIDAISDMQRQIDGILKVVEEERLEREKERLLVIKWETCERIAQGINDFVKENAKMSGQHVKELKCLWVPATLGQRNRYLPHLFTTWLLMWQRKDPEKFALPDFLEHLKDEDQSHKPDLKALSDDFDLAANCLWDTYEPLLLLMLQVFWLKPPERNNIQHPRPMADSAFSSLHLPDQYLSVTSSIVELGVKRERGKWTSLFGSEKMDKLTLMSPKLREETGKKSQEALHKVLRDWLEKARLSEVEKEGKRENQDDLNDRASKRAKHGIF